MMSPLLRNAGERKRLQIVATAVVALALAGGVGAVTSAPASADDHHGYERHDEHWRGRDWHGRHRGPPGYIAPAPVYAPPPVVYAPPPPPPGLNLIFPINIR